MPTCPNCKHTWIDEPTRKTYPWKITFENDSDQGGGNAAILFREQVDGDVVAVSVNGEAAKEGKPIKIWGDGKTVRSYLHGREMARQIWAILLRGQTGEAYEVGDETPVTMLQLAEFCAAGRAPKPEIIIQGGVDPMPFYIPRNTEKTKRLLTK